MTTLFDDDDSLLIDIQEPTETREVQSLGLMAVLPADFPLPSLIRFVPDPVLKAHVDSTAEAALALEVVGLSGLKQADLALVSVRAAVKSVREHFEDPASQAHALHVAITSCRGQWMQAGETAITVVGRRIAAETARLQAIADADRRKAQAEADAREREARRRQAEEAARQAVPEHIVQALRTEAETATAPPVAPAVTAPPPLASTTILQTWKARPAGTPADADPNPEIGDLSPMQVEEIRKLMRAAADGLESLAAFSIDWGYINKRAKAEGKAFRMVGLEAYQDSSTRAKPGRRRHE
jgi:hypothetical protein